MALQHGTRLTRAGDSAEAEDESLAARAAVGDDAAFELLVRRHERRIRGLLGRLCRDWALAEELAQEVFVQAWRKLGGFEGRGRFRSWLAALAYNAFLKHRRRNARHASSLSLDDPGTAAVLPEGADVTATASEQGLDLDRLLAVVSPEERELLVLCYGAGLSTPEIAAMLNLPAGTVKSQIHRAKHKIRRAFDIEGE